LTMFKTWLVLMSNSKSVKDNSKLKPNMIEILASKQNKKKFFCES